MRYHDWQSRLHNYLSSVYQTPFKYGVFDCGVFSSEAIEAMTGADLASQFRGRYTTRKEALKLVGTMEQVAERSGLKPVPVVFGQRGDLAVIRSGVKSSLGIVSLHGNDVLSPGKDGLMRVEMNQVTKVFRV